MSAIYVLATVIVGTTPLSAIYAAAIGAPSEIFISDNDGVPQRYVKAGDLERGWGYLVGAADALIYIFLPVWTTWLLRLIQRRPLHHRFASRSLLIGDVPWVSQTLEAFVSKTFALAYSIATISVSSGNPLDHLVHRHTHRVVRGGLLAVGRPDGRLNALTAAENTVCLSVNQASSIQNYGVTCESFTLGHNSFKLPLSASAVCMPTIRPMFLSEHAVRQFYRESGDGHAVERLSASALMGTLGTIELDVFSGVEPPPPLPKPEFFKRITPLWGKDAPDAAHAETFIGQWMAYNEELRGQSAKDLMMRQGQLQELYEGRFGSLHRLVGFFVMFHAMAKEVQDFWPKISCGMLGYDMSRSQSIMRIATTASPVSGSDVRHKMIELAIEMKKKSKLTLIKSQWIAYRLTELGLADGETQSKRRHQSVDIKASIDMLERLKRNRRATHHPNVPNEVVQHGTKGPLAPLSKLWA